MMRHRSVSRRRVVWESLGAAGCALGLLRATPAAGASRRQGAAYAISELAGGAGRASAVNASGQIAGLSGSTAALWTSGQPSELPIDLGAWPGDASSEALAINSAGVAVGVSWSTGSQPRGVAWSQGQVFELGTLPGGTESMAYGINSGNQAVGWSDAADGAHHAVLWDLAQGQIIDLGTGGGAYAEATGINDDNAMVGWADMNDGARHAVTIDRNGSFGDLGAPSIALAINRSGQVVGLVGADDGSDHATLWDASGGHDLWPGDAASQATAISDGGIVVGSVEVNGVNAPVYWDASTLEVFRLDSLVNDATVANGIDASGQFIVGESGGRPVLWMRA